MNERRPSDTAGTIAAHRAIESRKQADQRICYDPLAKCFLTPQMKVIGESWIPEKIALWIYELLLPGFHAYFAVRTRYLDDYLRSCIEDGLEQLVILGAGYDSRAYRFEELKARAKVFEVDHPATQRVKLAQLKRIFGTLPHHVSYVPVDFGKEVLEDKLRESGYDERLKTLFIWEGVTYYIAAESVDATLAFVAKNSGKGSSVIFDYTYPAVVAGTAKQRESKAWRTAVRRFGEPLVFGIEASAVEDYLSRRGFHKVNNATHEFFKKSYFTGANERRKLTTVFGIVHATVKTQAQA
jgi:methyltransferase (TIGR00027 family)